MAKKEKKTKPSAEAPAKRPAGAEIPPSQMPAGADAARKPAPPAGKPVKKAPEKKSKGSKSKREEKELLAQQLAYEQQLVKEGKIPVRDKYVPRTFFWRVFSVCLAFLMGIFASIGSIAIVCVVLLTGPSKNLLSSLSLDPSVYLKEEYLEKSVFDIYDEIVPDLNTLGDPSVFSIGTLAKYTPIIDNTIGTLTEKLAAFGVTLDRDDLYAQPISGLVTFLMDSVKTTNLQVLLDNFMDDSTDGMAKSVLDALSTYKNEDGTARPATLNDLLSDGGGMMTNALDSIYLKDVIDSDDPIITSLFTTTDEEGNEQFTSLGSFASDAQGLINNVSISVLLDIGPDDNPAMRYIAFGPELQKDESGNYIDIEDPANVVPVPPKDGGEPAPDAAKQYVGGGRYKIVTTEAGKEIEWLPDPNDESGNTLYAEKKVGDLSDDDVDLLGNATIKDLVSIESEEGFVYAVRNWTISDLQDTEKIKSSLTINDVLSISTDDSPLMNAIKDWKLGDLANSKRIERLKIGQILDVQEGDSPLMKAIESWRIGELSEKEKINSLALGDILEIGEGSPAMLTALADKTLGEISSSIDELTLEEALGKEAFGDNKILNALRYKKINQLGDAVKELTVYDVFGDEVYSFAKNYSEGVRPTAENVVKADAVESYYYKTDDSSKKALTANWYTGGEEGYTLVPAESVVAESYTEQEIVVFRKPAYFIVSYENTDAPQQPYTGEAEILTDAYGDYYLDEAGERIDLDTVYTYYTDEAFSEESIVEGKRIRERKDEDKNVTGYYYIEQIPVTLRYADGTQTYAESEVTMGYREKDTGAEVTAYYAGAWYLLLDNTDLGAMTPVTDMGALVSGVSEKINSLTLGQMYNHELISDDPGHEIGNITSKIAPSNPLYGRENLNELTITEVIELIKLVTDLIR